MPGGVRTVPRRDVVGRLKPYHQDQARGAPPARPQIAVVGRTTPSWISSTRAASQAAVDKSAGSLPSRQPRPRSVVTIA
jgi:hypothetical protein